MVPRTLQTMPGWPRRHRPGWNLAADAMDSSIRFQSRRRWRSVSAANSLLLFEAGVALVGAKCLARILPFSFLARALGKVSGVPDRAHDPSNHATFRIAWALRAIGRRVRPLNQCLIQAIAAHWMLRRRGMPAAIVLGVQKEGSDQLRAHAWVHSGAQMVVGGEISKSYRSIARFQAG
ncbi:MAG TPA: lasso peptide biosynthesis B2 protein [Bryobacteraceae bacterium]|nr:lasso peptide biosynthesis B2 protein [Bryobacteraceae bacterium]